MHTIESLIQGLQNLGIASGDVLFMHSSFKSLGDVKGGADTVIGALESVLGENGLLLLPSFHLLENHDERIARWDIETTASTVGWLTEFFRQMPGTYRSDHYSHSVAARGEGAEGFVADHLSSEGMISPWDRPPWGKTYGANSPMVRAYDRGGKLMMMGVDYYTSTYIHVVEVMYWNGLLKDNPVAPFLRLDRPKLDVFWDANGRLERGEVGDADCRCFGIRDYVDTLLEEVRRDPVCYDRMRER